MNRFIVIIMALGLFGIGSGTVGAAATPLPEMRISVENTASHFQTRAVERFAQQLKTALDGQIDVQFFSNARLFRDADVIRALGRGAVEMAVPGTWHVTRYVPDVGVFQLPVFYGRRAQDIYSILDSPLGKNLNARIEKTLNFKVIGGWIDLGYAHLFGIRQQIRQHEDIEGLKVRDDKGYWQQMETYIHEHSDAQFSHSICRECAEKFYPDLDIYEDENN